MDHTSPSQQHAFTHAPAALRIFRFAADSAPRVLELAHVSAFLRECAVEFGSADATLPGALRCEYASGRFFRLRAFVERNAVRCWWLAAKLLACRGGAPMPAAALAPDVTRHEVNWGAEGARRSAELQLTHDGYALSSGEDSICRWAHGAVGVMSGKHFFHVCVTAPGFGSVMVGWVDGKISRAEHDYPGRRDTLCSGCAYSANGFLFYGTAPLSSQSCAVAPATNVRLCVIGCLLNLAATPARMTVFVDGEPLAAGDGEQREYDLPKDGCAWYPSVCLWDERTALHSCVV
jgi:hypothetical protein